MNKNPQITAASFLMTEDCNLRCTYCFEEHRKKRSMSKEVIKAGLDFLCRNSLVDGSRSFHAILFGGEPLMEPDGAEFLLEYGFKLAEETNTRFTAGIITNATILTPRVQEILKKYIPMGLTVQLSIDGVKEAHDMYRVTVNGRGSFDTIEKNIPIWKELFKDHMHQLTVHGCSNKNTLKYLYESYIFFREEWEIPHIWFMPIHSEEWDEDDVRLYEAELNKIADYILDRARRENKLDEIYYYAPIDRCMRPDVRPNAPCGAGKSFATITAEGKISPCHHLYFNDPDGLMYIGDVFNGVDDMARQMYIDYENEDINCPLDCEAVHCYRCIAENYCQNGNPFSQIKGPRCEMSKIERRVQLRVRKGVEEMGLLNPKPAQYGPGNNPENPDCLCDARGTFHQGECNCKTTSDAEEVIASALTLILRKLDELEETQNFMLKKIL